MAKNTKKELRSKVMYSVFVRNYSEEGTFQGVQKDLDRIQGLGVDIIWFLPIHPIGKEKRKGTLGSPYAISDYRAVNPEYGTMEDFRLLVDEIHRRGMKCIIDVVYNHTSPDSWLAKHHPEWFYRREDGSFGNKMGEWLDVIDLDYSQEGLWEYQIDTLKQWASLVDGFRCDVAPLIPLEFWLRAREEVASVNGDCIWLSESVEPSFILASREKGIVGLSDSEIYQAFDICYDYDVYSWFVGYLTGENTLSEYAEHIGLQEIIYPDNYVKLRFLENHDQSRAKFLISDEKMLRNWLAFSYFQKGLPLIYAGEERGISHLPSLFDRDTLKWDTGIDFTGLLGTLCKVKKHPLMTDGSCRIRAAGEKVLCVLYRKGEKKLLGIFSVKGTSELISVDVAEGVYTNLLTGDGVEVHRGKVNTTGEPVVFEFTEGAGF